MKSEKKESAESSSYTIMIFKGSGKVKGLKISSRVVFWLFLCLVFYFVASGAIILEYIKSRSASREYLGELDALRSQTGKMKIEIFRAKENIKMLEEHVYYLDGKGKQKNPPNAVPEKKPVPARELSKQEQQKEKNKPTPQREENKQSTQAEGEVIAESKIDVRDLKFKKEGEKLSVVFNLTNMDENKGILSGYVHMLAFFGDLDSPRVQTYPGVKLKDGMPVWYKAGYFFKIARFMSVKGEFKLASAEDRPSLLKVLVYDNSGKLIFEEEYEADLAD